VDLPERRAGINDHSHEGAPQQKCRNAEPINLLGIVKLHNSVHPKCYQPPVRLARFV
jgi:hypothetical protein